MLSVLSICLSVCLSVCLSTGESPFDHCIPVKTCSLGNAFSPPSNSNPTPSTQICPHPGPVETCSLGARASIGERSVAIFEWRVAVPDLWNLAVLLKKSRRTDSNSAEVSRVSINGIVASGRAWFWFSHQLLCLLSHSSVATPVDNNTLCKSGIV